MLPGRVAVSVPSGRMNMYGETVVLQHGPNLFALYAHLQRRDVQKGDQVTAGTQLGTVGRTAGTREDPSRVFTRSGAHLHFEFLDRWPPAGRDLNRLDPGPIFAQLGVIVPDRGPLQIAQCAPEDPSRPPLAPAPPAPPAPPLGPPQPPAPAWPPPPLPAPAPPVGAPAAPWAPVAPAAPPVVIRAPVPPELQLRPPPDSSPGGDSWLYLLLAVTLARQSQR